MRVYCNNTYIIEFLRFFMRADYEKWEDGILEDERRKMRSEEGYPFHRRERIVAGGIISPTKDFDYSVPIAGTLEMAHPYGTDRVRGNLVSRWGESYVEGRLTEDEFDFIEFYTMPHSRGDTREYSLKKKDDVFEGRLNCSDKDMTLSDAFVRFDVISSRGICSPKEFELAVPQVMQVDHSKVRDFWDRLSSEK